MTSDASARAAALDPQRSFIVQAPAGSGKTELLTQRYLRLLATVESPEQILAITFTRKAAAEMRSRILLALDAAQGAPPESPHKRSTWELARAVRNTDARHGWRLTEHPARLRIQTIDALNASLARRLPVLAGTGAALEPTTDPRPFYDAAGQRLVERLGDNSAVAERLEVLVVHLGNRVDRLVELLSDLLAKRDQWLHPIVNANARENLRFVLESTLKRIVERHLTLLCEGLGDVRRRELFDLLQYAAGNLLGGDLDPVRRALLESCLSRPAAPDATSESLDAWRALVAMLFKKNTKGELYETVTKVHGFPTTNRDRKEQMLSALRWLGTHPALCERLFELRTLPDATYSDEQWRALQALLDLLPVAVAELQLEFQGQGKADYVEVALRALRALGTPDEPTDLALAFDYRLQHILVDEFQDTSFAQLDLLERLTGGWQQGDGRTLFCVGDPMQSIYRFRQAEVGLFIGLQQKGLGHLQLEPLRLEANFRSLPVIVNWVNTTFPDVLAPENDAEQGAVRYSASTAALAGDAGGVHVHAFVNTDPRAEAQKVTSIVRDSLQQDLEGRIAILVTARTHVELIAQHLAAAGVEFRAVEIEQLRERPVVQDLIALTRALVHLADRTAWFAVLRAPWCGLTLADLHALAAHGSFVLEEGIRAELDAGSLSENGQSRLSRVHEILSAALQERGRWPLRIWVERTWNALGGPATLSRQSDLDDAQSFFGRLDDIEVAGDLEDVARLEEQLDRLFASGQTHGDARVEIMTIHAAKGLEFETVILPGLQRQMRTEDRELLRWTRIAGEGGGMVFAPVKAEGSEGDPVYRWIELLERQRIIRERGRLLYVAATRAKHSLHLLGTVQARDRGGELTLREPTKGSMLRMLWHAVAPYFDAEAPSAPASSPASAAPMQQLHRVPLDWTPPAAEKPLHVTAAPIVDLEAERPIFDWVSETSRHVGTLVHRELERMCTSSDSAPASRSRLLLELAELGVPPDRCESGSDRVIAALQHTLSDKRGRWVLGLDGGIQDAASELALSGVLAGSIVEGIIDRTFVDEQGTRWVIDFKTSTHEGGGRSAFLDEEVARYRHQLLRYASLMRLYRPKQTVRAALYFPLMREWREVPLDEKRQLDWLT
ncbi:ATP-dependent exoDNAse (exonuclease V) beta subunit [Povalibacter uvarum]|uniref:DNA 3'-5' helicase n=1 Tax=Povalibacter uvarum TaxID=732238 RepID=A0A841HIM1_9GAMM|nr:UvrD-helicase domain-containing protein [Povalibacter uvarum]MBB6092078.1 ATP-dependent exoDNAse (exonuclease V) beta subunit [Povalibacter uvarum]